jgi:hypothetical protein
VRRFSSEGPPCPPSLFARPAVLSTVLSTLRDCSRGLAQSLRASPCAAARTCTRSHKLCTRGTGFGVSCPGAVEGDEVIMLPLLSRGNLRSVPDASSILTIPREHRPWLRNWPSSPAALCRLHYRLRPPLKYWWQLMCTTAWCRLRQPRIRTTASHLSDNIWSVFDAADDVEPSGAGVVHVVPRFQHAAAAWVFPVTSQPAGPSRSYAGPG